MRNFKSEGIIIKRKNYGESDRLITVFSKNHGKLVLMAKGVRKITSRRSPHIEMLNFSTLSIYKANIPILAEVIVQEDYRSIKDDLAKVGLAYHICELIDGLCPEAQENEEVFNLLQSTLYKLCESEDTIQLIHEFEVSLLTILGYWRSEESLTAGFNTANYIEDILERRLKSKRIFAQLQ